jgi:hypothetical protein
MTNDGESPHAHITRRERALLAALLNGRSVRAAADSMGIAASTARVHMRNLWSHGAQDFYYVQHVNRASGWTPNNACALDAISYMRFRELGSFDDYSLIGFGL